MEKIRKESGRVILLDSGDLLKSPGPLPNAPAAKEMLERRMDLTLKSYNLMGYDAFTPGEVDLTLGVQFLLDLKKKARFPFLLANFIEKESKKPVFQPYLIKEVGSMKVGIFGLISERLPLELPAEETKKYAFTEAIPAARKIVVELKKSGCKVILAVAHMDMEDLKALVRSVPEISLIVSGHIRDFETEPIIVDHTPIFIAGDRGEYLGQVELPVKGKAPSQFKLVALSDEFNDHPQAQGFLDQYRASVQKLSLASGPAAAPGIPGQALGYFISPYLGDGSCISCHEEQSKFWQKTAHGRAFQTLVKSKRSSDVTCLPCHTTGFDQVSQPGDLLENVQCESCHGPRRGHPDSGQKFCAVSEKQCLVCHNAAKSPKYQYETYLGRIRCPKG